MYVTGLKLMKTKPVSSKQVCANTACSLYVLACGADRLQRTLNQTPCVFARTESYNHTQTYTASRQWYALTAN